MVVIVLRLLHWSTERTHKTVLYCTHNRYGATTSESESTTKSNSPLPTLSGGDDLLFYCSTNARLL